MKESGGAMTEERVWEDWPRCPACGRRRQTVCPSCGNAGTAMPLAEYQAAGAPLRSSRPGAASSDAEPTPSILLHCSECDEAFAPRFYRICPACGADAGEGLDLPSPPEWHLNDRVTLAITGLIAVVSLLLLYFWLLFRQG